MKAQVVKLLDPKPNQLLLDMTFGSGGHTRALLDKIPDLHCYCLDRDPSSLPHMERTKSMYEEAKSFVPIIGRFSDLPGLHQKHGLQAGSVDMIIMDLGTSSEQLDTLGRGFSFKTDQLLDMRMNQMDAQCVTAADVVNTLNAADLAQIFKLYGEERFARRIANAIVDYRQTMGPLRTTGQLAEIACTVLPSDYPRSAPSESHLPKTHPATRVFQALRIFINDELNELCYGLELARRLLKRPSATERGGRLAVISFHSLEDRLVKWAFSKETASGETSAVSLADRTNADFSGMRKRHSLLSGLSMTERCEQPSKEWTSMVGPLVPTDEEIMENPRSRSAKLRCGEKL